MQSARWKRSSSSRPKSSAFDGISSPPVVADVPLSARIAGEIPPPVPPAHRLMVAIPADPARPTYDLQAPTPERLSAPATPVPRDDASQVLSLVVVAGERSRIWPLSKRGEIDLPQKITPRTNAAVARMTTPTAKNTPARRRRRFTRPPPARRSQKSRPYVSSSHRPRKPGLAA